MGLLDFFFGRSAPKISPQEAYRRTREDDPRALLVDVRQPSETESGIAPSALCIPLTQLESHLEELPGDRQIMTICSSGHRSPFAARRLRKAGFTVRDVEGGMQAWKREGLPVVAEE